MKTTVTTGLTERITISPGAKVWHPLPDVVKAALLEWLRANGIDPRYVPDERQIVLDPRGVECWWLLAAGAPEQPAERMLEVTCELGEIALARLRVEASTAMPGWLAVALTKHALGVRQGEAEIRASIAAAEAYAEHMERTAGSSM